MKTYTTTETNLNPYQSTTTCTLILHEHVISEHSTDNLDTSTLSSDPHYGGKDLQQHQDSSLYATFFKITHRNQPTLYTGTSHSS